MDFSPFKNQNSDSSIEHVSNKIVRRILEIAGHAHMANIELFNDLVLKQYIFSFDEIDKAFEMSVKYLEKMGYRVELYQEFGVFGPTLVLSRTN